MNVKSGFDTRRRLAISIGIGLLVGLLSPPQLKLPLRVIIGWDIGVIAFLILVAVMMTRSSHQIMRARATVDNERRWQVLLGVLTGCGMSLLAIVYMLKDGKNLGPEALTLKEQGFKSPTLKIKLLIINY